VLISATPTGVAERAGGLVRVAAFRASCREQRVDQVAGQAVSVMQVSEVLFGQRSPPKLALHDAAAPTDQSPEAPLLVAQYVAHVPELALLLEEGQCVAVHIVGKIVEGAGRIVAPQQREGAPQQPSQDVAAAGVRRPDT